MLQKSLRGVGIRFKNPCEFWSGLGRGSGGAPWRNEGPMMQGRRHRRLPHGKARAMACGSNPRALPDLRADAVPPTPKKRGRRRLTALEVVQAKSAFCRKSGSSTYEGRSKVLPIRPSTYFESSGPVQVAHEQTCVCEPMIGL